MTSTYYPPEEGLYNPLYEHDACGVGMVADIHGRASHEIVLQGMTVLERLLHRGAAGSDPETGDGAGILTQIPHDFFAAGITGFTLPEAGQYAVAMLFLPQDNDLRPLCRTIIERTAAAEGIRVLGWRAVPVDATVIGEQARASAPAIEQCFLAPEAPEADDAGLQRRLYVLRRCIENAVAADLPDLGDRFYIASLSARTLVYKGLLKPPSSRSSTGTSPTRSSARQLPSSTSVTPPTPSLPGRLRTPSATWLTMARSTPCAAI